MLAEPTDAVNVSGDAVPALGYRVDRTEKVKGFLQFTHYTAAYENPYCSTSSFLMFDNLVAVVLNLIYY